MLCIIIFTRESVKDGKVINYFICRVINIWTIKIICNNLVTEAYVCMIILWNVIDV